MPEARCGLEVGCLLRTGVDPCFVSVHFSVFAAALEVVRENVGFVGKLLPGHGVTGFSAGISSTAST